MTWNQIIAQAFVDLGVIRPGESITGSSYETDAQPRLNELLSSLSTEGLMAFQQVQQTFSLVAGTSAYTLGSGGTFATTGSARAQKVTAWHADGTNIADGGPVLSLAEVGAVAKQYSGDTRAVPRAVGADTSYPLINVLVAPPPSSSPGTLTLSYFTPITQIADFTATPSLPEGWLDMLHFNLALRLFPIYARVSTQGYDVLAAQAQNSKASIVNQNTPGSAAAQTPQGQ